MAPSLGEHATCTAAMSLGYLRISAMRFHVPGAHVASCSNHKSGALSRCQHAVRLHMSNIRVVELPVWQIGAIRKCDAFICAGLAKLQVHAREVLHHDHCTETLVRLTCL